MPSSNVSNTGMKTLNNTQQQYKETEEIVENNPGIILHVTKLRTKISSNNTLQSTYERCYHTASFSDRAMAAEWLNSDCAKDFHDLQKFSYANSAFVGDRHEVDGDR